MITKTILAVQKYKIMDIISASDINICIQNLESLYRELNRLRLIISNRKNFDDIINDLQKINNELSALFRTSGTYDIEHLITVAMGIDFFKLCEAGDDSHIFDVIRQYVHPISYKVMTWRDEKKKSGKKIHKNRIVDDFMIVYDVVWMFFDVFMMFLGCFQDVFGMYLEYIWHHFGICFE